MANEVSRAEYSALLDRHQSVIDQIRAHGGEVSEQDGALSVALPKAEKPSDALKKANAQLAEAQLARDELARENKQLVAVAESSANEIERLRDASKQHEAKSAELQKMLDELTAPPAAEPQP